MLQQLGSQDRRFCLWLGVCVVLSTPGFVAAVTAGRTYYRWRAAADILQTSGAYLTYSGSDLNAHVAASEGAWAWNEPEGWDEVKRSLWEPVTGVALPASTDDAALARLRHFPYLKQVDLNSCDKLSPFAFDVLWDMQHLEELNLSGSSVSTLSVGNIGRCRTLRTLDASHTMIGDEALAVIARCPALQELRLPRNATPSGVESLDAAQNLELLDFDSVYGMGSREFAAKMATAVASLDRIRAITHFGSNGVTDACVRTLCQNDNLKVLDVADSPNVTNMSVEFLSVLPHLESLDLSGTAVTDGVEKSLMRCKTLTSLRLYDIGLSRSSRDAIRRSMPVCNVQGFEQYDDQ